MNRLLARALALLLGVCVGAMNAFPPSSGPETGLPFLRNFTPKETGGGTQNWAFVQDPRGVLYVGNHDGILEFDGVRWRLIPTLKRTVVVSFAMDPSGRIFVGAQGEIGYLAPDPEGRMHFVSLTEGIPSADRVFQGVQRIHLTPQGVLFKSRERIFLVSGNRVQVWKPAVAFLSSFQVGDRIYVQEQGRGLMEWNQGSPLLVPEGERLALEPISALLPQAEGSLLLATRSQGLFRVHGSTLVPFPTQVDASLKAGFLTDAVILRDGTLILATHHEGLFLLDAKGRFLGRIGKPQGLVCEQVRALFLDRQGGLWIGLDKGLARAEVASPVTWFNDSTGLGSSPNTLHRQGGLFLAGTAGGAFGLEGKAGFEARFKPLQGGGTPGFSFLDLGAYALLANYRGVFEVRGFRTRLVRPSSDPSYVLHGSRKDPARVFVGLRNGLASLRQVRGRWIDEGQVPGVTEQIRTLFEDREGRLWLGSWNQGVLRLTFPPGWPGSGLTPAVESFGPEAGLPDARDNRVYPFQEDALFATHLGIYRFDAPSRRFLPDARFAHLFPHGPRWVMGIRVDAQGRLWMHAVDEARDHRETGAAVPQPDGTYRWQPTPPLPITVTDNDLSTWVDPSDVVWFGSPADGIFRFDPAVPKDLSQPFRALVRRVLARGEHLIFGGGGKASPAALKYADNALRFEFAAPSFDGLAANRYSVLLEGVDREWSPWSVEAYRDYTNLRERSYRFRVRAMNVYGTLSEEDVFTFQVLPPWYRTLWAYLTYLLAATGTAAAGLRWRLRHLEREKLALEQLVEARTRSLAESHAQALLLEMSQARAEAQAKAKGEFLANMSHEIRTPMNAIIGFAHLGLKLGLEPRPRDYFQKISNASKSLLGIINDILDFTKIEAGRLELEAIPFRVTDVMHQVADILSPKASEKGVELLVSIGEEVPRSLVGDPLRLGQVIMNLASNAIKFTERGQVLVKVGMARTDGRTAQLRFEVKDSGIGMGPEALERLFQAFTQADTSMTRRFGGTGLGLVISKRLVDLMGGEIGVESETGKGSTFTFTATFEIADVQPEPRRGLRPDLWGLKVLVVDDNQTARQVFHEQVRSLGFDVTSVGSGIDALLELERAEGTRPYDLVLMDWRLQGVDGVETSRRIHRDLRLAHRPTILLMTAFGREEAMRNAEQAGIQGFIAKPVNPDLLMDAILEAMGRGQEPMPIPKESPSTATAQNLLAGSRVLLAEDNPINQEVATEILSAAGIHVEVARNGVEAVRKAGAADYDAILMDVQMPEMDGKQATAAIREQPRNKDLPIIAMTAHAMAGYRDECLDAGMNDYLSKPIDPQNLFEILSRWIKGRISVAESQGTESGALEAGISDPTGAFDVPAGLRRLGGNQAFYLRLVGGFATDFAQAYQEIRTALDASDLAKAEHLAHTLKGVAGNLSAVTLARATAPLEAALRARDAEAVTSALPAFEAALAQALASAPKLADTLEPPSTPAPAMEGRAVAELMKELEIRLGQGDPRAEDSWKALAAALPGAAFEGPLRKLGEGLEAFDFRSASATLKHLQETLRAHTQGGS